MALAPTRYVCQCQLFQNSTLFIGDHTKLVLSTTVFNYTPISDICFYLHVTMETVSYNWEILIHCKNPDDPKVRHPLIWYAKC